MSRGFGPCPPEAMAAGRIPERRICNSCCNDLLRCFIICSVRLSRGRVSSMSEARQDPLRAKDGGETPESGEDREAARQSRTLAAGREFLSALAADLKGFLPPSHRIKARLYRIKAEFDR